jgi:hypothetical protein
MDRGTDYPSQVLPVYKRIEDLDDVVIQRQCFAIADTRASPASATHRRLSSDQKSVSGHCRMKH